MFLKDGNLDIVGLQEVAFHSCPIIESRYRLLANVGPNKNGTAILVRHGSHLNTERNNFLRQTAPAYTITTRLPFVLTGDFNCVDDIQDKASSDSFTSQSNIVSYALKEMGTGLDLHRTRSPAGLWKLNTSVLSEEGYQNYVQNFIRESANHPLRESNVLNWWESVLNQEMAEADTFDWVAFHQLRKFSKFWEESTLKGYGIRSRCFEGQEVKEANIFHPMLRLKPEPFRLKSQALIHSANLGALQK
ncbi:hypothetical protein OUZ56_018705 [Daphnia magna]|uniref:Endonuclease/exonuclease/phosphatase domain-containing protein n=1 Tax=Daphnia magna TaxID=35525 RepID=A0ABQ9Z9J2_9CRUS|nr:hypothetical protein OUZ56_018705 [Daphnia magna]